MSVTYRVRFFVAPNAILLVSSSLLLVFSCLPLPLLEANCASTLRGLAIAVEGGLAVDLGVDLMEELDSTKEELVKVAVESWPPEVAGHDEVSTLTEWWLREEAEKKGQHS